MHFDFSVKFLISLMLAPVSVYGSLPDSVSSHTNIPEVVVTGEKHASVPTTNTSQTINLKKSDRLVLQNVSDAVRRMAGAEIKDYGGIGGLKTVSVRGLGSKHTLVCYDGMPVTDCQNGQVDLGRFSLDQLDEIRLYIGENCDIDAGALHFVSPSTLNLMSSAPIYSDKNYNAVAKITGGSFGFVNPYVSFDHKLGDHNSIKASANFSRADGMYPYTLTNGKLKTEEIRRHSATAGGHAELSSAFYLSPKSQLKAKAYYYVSDRELPGGVIYYNTESNETLKDKNAFAQAQFRTDWEKTTLLVNGKFNWSACYYHDEAMMYPGGKLDNRYFQREWYGTAVVRHNFTEHFSMANATDYILNSFNSNIHGCVFPQRHTVLDALSGNFKNEKVTATATLLGSFFFNQVEVGEAPDNYQHLSPSIAVSYKPFAPSIYFSASYKNIFRMPNFNELYFNSFGVRTLEP
ncbi:MAG: TonB-dependent receptor, partial [Paludibacteraceae bacterium]|nr:TonB-dependent receptor [Paludibacteraceae bacterium]